MEKTKNEIFIEKAKKIHNNKYDYSKVNYVNSTTKVCIVCPEHGEFWQTPTGHLKNGGCKLCGVLERSKKRVLNNEDFIKKAMLKHNGKYDYSKVEYVNAKTKVCIICPKHGEFWQTPSDHLRGKGCKFCSNNTKSTSEIFIKKAKEIHKDKYDYSKVQYINNSTKVCIICPIHGEFLQVPSSHLQGCGCKKCADQTNALQRRMSIKYFINKSQLLYGDKYDYSKVNYVNGTTKVCIICPEHGEFWQTPSSHLQGHGCSKCAGNLKLEKESFVIKSNHLHNNKYDYSKAEYLNNKTKVCIICPIHGEFWQTPHSHLNGCGCPKCGEISSNLHKIYTTSIFINKSNIVHNFKYLYEKTKYVNSIDKVCIICPKHGEFWQRPDKHIKGQGCPKCNSSHMETHMRNLLTENHIHFEEQKKFDWLGRQSLDFYLPDHNIAIECQGIQHFEINEYFGGEESLYGVVQRDQNKRQLCEENGIHILYYANYDYEFPYEVYTDDKILINKIAKYKNNLTT